MRLSARARYALRLMIDLAENPGTQVSLRDVAARQRISKRYLEQVAVGLRNANLVITSAGRGGGYSLPRPAAQIAVLEIIVAAVGPLDVVRCVDAPQICSSSVACASRRLWARLNQQIKKALGEVPLSELCDGVMAGTTSGNTPCTSAGH
jgi:Rrf2 family transcriptional regulator, iron-sulfur cluster assembly transcription factor